MEEFDFKLNLEKIKTIQDVKKVFEVLEVVISESYYENLKKEDKKYFKKINKK
jgi:hypothetical protein